MLIKCKKHKTTNWNYCPKCSEEKLAAMNNSAILKRDTMIDPALIPNKRGLWLKGKKKKRKPKMKSFF